MSCCCNPVVRIRYYAVCACSGASDTGQIGDRAARKLAAEKIAKMSCTAAIAVGDQEIMDWTVAATAVVAIDGCEKDCSRKVLESRGFTDLVHVRVTDLGMVKGKTPITDEAVNRVVAAARERLGK